MPDTKAPEQAQTTPAPKAGVAPLSLADWTHPRLPQPLDIVEVVGGGGGGGGGGPSPYTSTPTMNAATGSPGTVAQYSRGNHVHPTDSSRQATLVSGTNIKTVNSQSLLGSGDIAISGGGTPSDTNPQMDGTAAPGTSTDYSRADHRHPSDTSRQASLVSGTNIRTVNGQSLLTPMTDLVISGGAGTPSDTNPSMNGAVAPGTATAYSRGDHVHPSDTSRLPLTGGTLSNFLTLHAAPTANNHAATKAYVDGFGPTIAAFNALVARVVALEAGGGGPGPSGYTLTLTTSVPVNFASPGGHQLALSAFTGWQAAFAADFTADLYNNAQFPNQASLPMQLSAKYSDQAAFVQIPFDNFATPLAAGRMREWGIAGTAGNIMIYGNNTTGNPIEIKIESA